MAYQFITCTFTDGVATITLDRPDVLNAFNRAMALELQLTLGVVAQDPAIRAVLLTGAGRAFCAGQDLGEAVPAEGPAPDLGDIVHDCYNPIVRLVRALEKPVICAVNGVAAGAGANLALACDILIAAEEAAFIQSFAKIGLIPDTGGTYFLPRLVGLHRATAMMMLGERVTAAKALELGHRARRGAARGARRYRVRPRPVARRAGDARVRAHQARAQPLAGQRPRRATRLRGGTAARGRPDDGLSGRRARVSRQAQTRVRGPLMPLDAGTVVGVVGAGAMGAGIAQVAAVRGHRVILSDAIDRSLDRARSAIGSALDRQVEKGKLAAADADAARARIAYVAGVGEAEWAAFAPCGLVIEAIVEDLALKKAVFGALERVVAGNAVLATNTSSLSVAAIGGACAHPGRVVGIHFFNPAPVMPLVEIVGAITTDAAVVAAARAFVDGWGKTTVVASDTPGFIVNRVARPFYGEALRIAEEGIADYATIDWAMRDLGGFQMGPFELMDFIGNDVNYAVTCSVFESMYLRSAVPAGPHPAPAGGGGAPRPQVGAGLLRLSRGRPRALAGQGPCGGAADRGPHRRDADQRGGGRAAPARGRGGRHRVGDDEGRELPQGAAGVGRRIGRAHGDAAHHGAPRGVRRGPVPAQSAPAAAGQGSAENSRVNPPAPGAQELAEAVVAGMRTRDAFSRWLGVEVSAVAPGRCTVRMTVRDEMVNGFGLAHGAIAYALADSALAFASNTNGRVTVSIENSIGYPAAVHPGNVLTAVAEELSAAHRVAFYQVTVRNEAGVTVAVFRGTVYRTRRDHPSPDPTA